MGYRPTQVNPIARARVYASNLKPLLEPHKNDNPQLSAFYCGYLELIDQLERAQTLQSDESREIHKAS